MDKKLKKGSFEGSLSSSKNIDYSELKTLYEKLKETVEVIEENKKNIPLCIFSKELSGLENIVKYLKLVTPFILIVKSELSDACDNLSFPSSDCINNLYCSSFIFSFFGS